MWIGVLWNMIIEGPVVLSFGLPPGRDGGKAGGKGGEGCKRGHLVLLVSWGVGGGRRGNHVEATDRKVWWIVRIVGTGEDPKGGYDPGGTPRFGVKQCSRGRRQAQRRESTASEKKRRKGGKIFIALCCAWRECSAPIRGCFEPRGEVSRRGGRPGDGRPQVQSEKNR